MTEQLYSLTPAQLGATTALMGIGLLAACLVTMGQWLLHRRRLSSLFLLSVTVLFSYYTWAFATVLIHSESGIFTLQDYHFGWFVMVCLALGIATLGTPYRYSQAPLLVMLIPALPPLVDFGGVWLLLSGAFLTTAWLCVQVWREWNLLRRDLSPFSVKEALDRLESGVLFADSRGHNLLVNATMERLLASLGLTSLTRYGPLSRQLRQLAGTPSTGNEPGTVREGLLPSGPQDNVSMRLTEDNGLTWMLTQTSIRDGEKTWTQLFAADVSEYMTLSRQLSAEIEALQERQTRLVKETSRLDAALSRRLVLTARSTIHDTLSQRISFVHRFLEDEVSDDARLRRLQNLLEELPSDLSHERAESTPKIWLETLQDLAAAAELDLQLSGELPAQTDQARMFIEVLRESITNVLIHTTSTTMEARLWEDDHDYWLEVSNPVRATEKLTYGTGLSGLESRLEALGGSLHVSTTPRFTLRANLPKTPSPSDNPPG